MKNILDFDLLKERFIKSYDNEDTQLTIRYILFNDIVKRHEKILGKDLSHFNKDEIINLLGEFGSQSVKTVDSKRSYISQYINFAIKENFLTTGINHANNINFDIIKSLADQRALKNKYITEEELHKLIEDMANPQDQALFLAIFEGVLGEKMCELINLKITDIDEENCILKLITREKKVSRKLINLLLEAHKQGVYYVNNGERISKRTKIGLLNTEYIFKPTSRKDNIEDAVSPFILSSRIKKVATILGNKYLTANSILESGMINLAKKIKSSKDELEQSDYEYICEEHGKNPKMWALAKRLIENID